MSEDKIAALLARSPVEKAELLIATFTATQNEHEKARILTILGILGDAEIAGNFLADVVRSASHRLKFHASVQGEMSKFDNHFLLRKALKAHLQGKSPAEVWIRNAFPDG